LPLLFPNLTDAEYQSIAHEFGLDDSGTIKYEKFVECAAVKIKKDKGLK
jgi:Ca2+-binding EF-hand superfamily protein